MLEQQYGIERNFHSVLPMKEHIHIWHYYYIVVEQLNNLEIHHIDQYRQTDHRNNESQMLRALIIQGKFFYISNTIKHTRLNGDDLTRYN